MLVFDKLWVTMKEKGISQYTLINEYGFSSSTMHLLRHNGNAESETLSRLCNILECKLSEIAEEDQFPEDPR